MRKKRDNLLEMTLKKRLGTDFELFADRGRKLANVVSCAAFGIRKEHSGMDPLNISRMAQAVGQPTLADFLFVQ